MTSLRKILMVLDSLDGGGAEQHVAHLAGALQRRGIAVVAACSTEGPLVRELRDSEVAVHPLMPALVKRKVSRDYATALRAVVRTQNPDLVHAHMFASQVAAAEAVRGSGIPLVLTEHSEATWRSPADQRISYLTYRQADSIIAVSRPIARLLAERYGVPRDRVELIPPAVTAHPAAVPMYHPEGSPLVGVVGRLTHEKGVDLFLAAVPRIRRVHPSAQFIIVGSGSLRADLERMAHGLSLDDFVSFLGYRSDARQLISLLDVLVVPSRSEGSPLVISEAMTGGTPVVGTRVGGIPDMIRHGDRGLLVPPEDPEAIGDAVMMLANNSALASRLTFNARLHVNRYSHEVMVERHIRHYLDTLRKPFEGQRSSSH